MPGLAMRLAAALLASAALLVPVAANAKSLTVEDATSDAKAINILSIFLESAADQPPFTAAPAETSTDITSTTIDYTDKRLTVTTHLRDIVEASEYTFETRIRTPEGRFALAMSVTDSGRVETSFYPRTNRVESFKPCRTVRGRYDVAADRVVVSVPAACLDKAAWVQIANVASRVKVTPVADGSTNLAGYADDAFRSGLSIRSVGFSPKVRRG